MISLLLFDSLMPIAGDRCCGNLQDNFTPVWTESIVSKPLSYRHGRSLKITFRGSSIGAYPFLDYLLHPIQMRIYYCRKFSTQETTTQQPEAQKEKRGRNLIVEIVLQLYGRLLGGSGKNCSRSEVGDLQNTPLFCKFRLFKLEVHQEAFPTQDSVRSRC